MEKGRKAWWRNCWSTSLVARPSIPGEGKARRWGEVMWCNCCSKSLGVWPLTLEEGKTERGGGGRIVTTCSEPAVYDRCGMTPPQASPTPGTRCEQGAEVVSGCGPHCWKIGSLTTKFTTYQQTEKAISRLIKVYSRLAKVNSRRTKVRSSL